MKRSPFLNALSLLVICVFRLMNMDVLIAQTQTPPRSSPSEGAWITPEIQAPHV
jgi:hypothetical protein